VINGEVYVNSLGRDQIGKSIHMIISDDGV